ncbi:hypothetical protein PHISP_08581, partial [Aspergillus sp. HF37]
QTQHITALDPVVTTAGGPRLSSRLFSRTRTRPRLTVRASSTQSTEQPSAAHPAARLPSASANREPVKSTSSSRVPAVRAVQRGTRISRRGWIASPRFRRLLEMEMGRGRRGGRRGG